MKNMLSTLIANFSGVGDVNSSAACSLSAYLPLIHTFQFEPGAEVSPSQQPVKSQRFTKWKKIKIAKQCAGGGQK